MENSTPAQDYLSVLRDSAPKEHPIQQMLREPHDGNQRVCYFDLEHPFSQPVTLETLLSWTGEVKHRAVCVIESICPKWIAALGVAWRLDPAFFLDHTGRQQEHSLWDSVMLAKNRPTDSVTPPLQHAYIEGVLPHLSEAALGNNRVPRRHEYDRKYGWQATTRISYYRASKNMYLFLVDSPFPRGEPDSRWLSPSKLSFWVPYSRNRGGLPIPQLYGMTTWAPFELLQSFLCYSRHSTLLFEAQYDVSPQTLVATGPVVFSQFPAASLWKTNIDHIDRDLKVTAFRDLRMPNIETNNRLHELREDLNTLRYEATLAKDWLLEDGRYPHRFPGKAPGTGHSRVEWPADMLANISERVLQTERFLMDTFQLLMSSISVMDSQHSIQDAKRSALLTQLASIYVPLSFVTGIWGMNIKEINDSPHPLWIFGVTLLIAIAVTVAGLLTLRYWERIVALSRRRRLARSTRDGDLDTRRDMLK